MMNAAEFHRRMAEVEKPNQALAALPPVNMQKRAEDLQRARDIAARAPRESQEQVMRWIANRWQHVFEGVVDMRS